jgi:hypothetical protein
MSNNAQILVYSNGPGNATLSFTTANFYENKTLNVYLNGEQVFEGAVNGYTHVGFTVKLVSGNNLIRFYTPEGYVRPADMPELNTSDPRNLSIAILNMTITA